MNGAVSLFVAEYNADGVLAGVVKTDIDITSQSQDVTIKYTKKQAANKLKMFAWQDMKPIAAPAEIADKD